MKWPWSRKPFEPLNWDVVFRVLSFRPAAEVTVQAATVNHDYLTRLDSKELKAMQDGGRNCLILLQCQQKLFRRELAELSRTNAHPQLIGLTKIYTEIGVAIERLDKAVYPEEKN